MKRRAFLKLLGLAPVAAAVPAMALPRAEKPMATGGVVKGKVDYLVGETPGESILIDANKAGPSQIVIDFDALSADIQKMWSENIEWATGPHQAIAQHIDSLAIDVPVYDRLKHGDDFDAWFNRVTKI